jgi:hypothetical protein
VADGPHDRLEWQHPVKAGPPSANVGKQNFAYRQEVIKMSIIRRWQSALAKPVRLLPIFSTKKRRPARLLTFLLLVVSLANPLLSQQDWTTMKALAQTASGTIIFMPSVLDYNAPAPSGTAGWPTVAANLQRTSWTADEVSGDTRLMWYRPIEAFIPQNVQLIASDGMIFVSTSQGLYALNANNGQVVWRFDTEMPLGNSPTVDKGVVYVGGYDRKLHALDVRTGAHLWAYEGAQAGFSTNPLVVDGKVIAGNRDGYMYAVGAHRTSSQGKLIWKYKTGGPIDLTAAYQSGMVYFASGDNYAYALRTSNGSLAWKSDKLPGDGYHSYWPVVYRDKVIFSGAAAYRAGLNPGTASLMDPANAEYGKIYDMERDDLFSGQPDGTELGPTVPNQGWAGGNTVIDVSRVTEYLENNPNGGARTHKPWRRVMVVLNTSNGQEYTFDSDGDGYPETMPVVMWGTHSGNRYPPIVGSDDVLYQSNLFEKLYIPQGRVMGWLLGTQYMSLLGGQGAVDEPNAISGGGKVIYRTICCDRVGDWFTISKPTRSGSVWDYSNTLSELAPDYDMMWWGMDPNDPDRLEGNYGTQNGLYHNHGDQNALIPYEGKLFVHRSNAVLAFGKSQGPGKLPLLELNSGKDQMRTPTTQEIEARLEEEVRKMIEAGHLRPGYYNNGQFGYKELTDYFDNPGDTLYTLARAYPHLPAQLQAQTREYLKGEFRAYFDPTMYSLTGWAEGEAREAMPLPPDVTQALPGLQEQESPGPRWPWRYPQGNFYAMWKYVQILPEDTARAYQLAKSKLEVPVASGATNDYLEQKPWIHNGYIDGYIGFLHLQELAGKTVEDAALRQKVTAELNRLQTFRSSAFTKDTYWVEERYHLRSLNVARNFIMLVPELGDYLNQNALNKVREALQEYSFVAPYWFVARYNAIVDEGVMAPLYDVNALFSAKAYILKEPQEELARYLDAPAFERGDLFYIQNLVAVLEAP